MVTTWRHMSIFFTLYCKILGHRWICPLKVNVLVQSRSLPADAISGWHYSILRKEGIRKKIILRLESSVHIYQSISKHTTTRVIGTLLTLVNLRQLRFLWHKVTHCLYSHLMYLCLHLSSLLWNENTTHSTVPLSPNLKLQSATVRRHKVQHRISTYLPGVVKRLLQHSGP